MKFYIASNQENYKQVQKLANILKEFGWEHTYDWTIHIPLKEIDIETLKLIGQNEFEGVKNADIVVILIPKGRGTHVELGVACALNKTTYIYHTDNTFFKCDNNTSTFYWLPNIKHFTGSIEELVKRITIDNFINT